MHVVNEKKLQLKQQGYTTLDSVLSEIEVEKLDDYYMGRA